MKPALSLVAVLVLAGAGLMAYIRFAPDDPGRWHVAVRALEDEANAAGPGLSEVSRGAVGFVPATDPAKALARLAEVAAASPRTTRLAGSVAEGRITWVARSALMGYPDYITAEATPLGVRLWSRQRYGSRDQGVNLLRLTDWLARL